MITHRLGSVRHADYIYSLDRGRIAEHGTFADLLAAGGAFAELYQLQASQYGINPVADTGLYPPAMAAAT